MMKMFGLADGKLIPLPNGEAHVYVYFNPDEKEKSFLTGQLLIDDHTLSSSLDPEELGRIEFEENHLAAIIKRPKKYCSQDNFIFKMSSVGIFLFADQLIIVVREEDLSLDGRVFSKMHTLQDVF